MPNLEKTARVLAYQKSTLLDIQGLYETLRCDLNEYFEQEQQIAEEISILQRGFADLLQRRKTVPLPPLSALPESQEHSAAPAKTYARLNVPAPDTLELLCLQAEKYLRQRGIDLHDDPLPAILDAREILDIADAYRKKYGAIKWNRADYLVVTLAGMMGTLLDLFLGQIPGNPRLLLTLPQGYALTDWIRKNSQHIQDEYLVPIQVLAQKYLTVSADAQEQIEHFMARQRADDQDALLSFILGVLDIVRYSGTFIDQHGNVVVSERFATLSDNERTTWIVKRLLRLFSEAFASAGMAPPFGRLLVLVQNADAPDSSESAAEDQASWNALIAYLHSHGYNGRDFLMMGIVPAAIESIVRGYWLLQSFDAQEHLDRVKVKMTSMLLLSHAISLSGNVMKTGLLFQLNPLLLNWSHLLRFFPLMVCWIHEGIEREKCIRAKLDDEWLKLYQRFNQSEESNEINIA
ncbi:hypothetical protein U27_06529 [Candidatus Vecturithrix granuli]|uniref:Uncharacterized protein n=1 Tax=Vecturithrix granuli TaxID=1499967 RepID=A0A081C4N9_VECG1|nr:hypothetical protein U27_06529 [Candidatus Vecturithrix granuli]